MNDRPITYAELKAILERSSKRTPDGVFFDPDAAIEQLEWIVGKAPAGPEVDKKIYEQQIREAKKIGFREALSVAAMICDEVAEEAKTGSKAEIAARLCAVRIRGRP